jgi:subtilisin family serine protease
MAIERTIPVTASRRALRAGAAAWVLVAVAAAQDMSGFAYRHGKEARPLTLDPTRIAMQIATGSEGDGPSAADLADILGIAPEGVRPYRVEGWTLIDLPYDLRSADRVVQLAQAVGAAFPGRFASPVFVGDDGGEIIPGRDLFFRLREGVEPGAAEQLVAEAGGGVVLGRDWRGLARVVHARPATAHGLGVLAFANALAERPEVEFAEPDFLFTGRSTFVPNDALFGSSWHLSNPGGIPGYVANVDVDAPEAWDVEQGDPGLLVVIFDTGIDPAHPDLNVVPGADFTGSPALAGAPGVACDRHGTAVAGCISSILNNSLGTAGVAPRCRVACARPFVSTSDCAGTWNGTSAQIASAITWAQTVGARVTNDSNYYGGLASSLIATAYATTKTQGVVHFASAGNGGGTILVYPASLPDVNAVAALDPSGVLANFAGGCFNGSGSSTSGPGIDFSAPGEDIQTTDRTGAAGYVAGDYVCTDGTSFASPIAAAVAALVLSRNPALTALQVEAILQSTSTDLGAPGYDTTYGYGRVNAAAAVAAAGPTATTLASTASGGAAISGGAAALDLSADGRFVLFRTADPAAAPGDANGFDDVFRKDLTTGTTVRVSEPQAGGDANGPSVAAAASADGVVVAWASTASNLGPADGNGLLDVYVKNLGTGVVVRASTGPGGADGDGPSGAALAISADGRYAAFESAATNLVAGDTNGAVDIFVFDSLTGVLERAGVGTGGAQAFGDSVAPSLSADGRYLAFASDAPGLVAGDVNGVRDVFIRDRTLGVTTRSASGSGASDLPAISDDGTVVAFESTAPDLVVGDTNGAADVFVFNVTTSEVRRASVLPQGGQAAGGADARLSADGRFVVFRGDLSPLLGPSNGFLHWYRHDRQTSATVRVDTTPSGAPGGGSAGGGAALSDDGRYVAFESAAADLVLGDGDAAADAFLRDFGPTPPTAVPTISQFSPTTAVIGGPDTALVLQGFGFSLSSVVRWNGVDLATTFTDAFRLDAIVPAAFLAMTASASVTVFTPPPGGGLSAAGTFQVVAPAPVLTSVTPQTAAAGSSAVVLTALGSNFQPSSIVRFGTTNLATTYTGGSQLTATVPASLLAAGANVNVTVQTPAPGGGTSAPQVFVVSNPVPGLVSTSPSSVFAGSPTTTVLFTGSNFVTTSQARFNATALTTTFVSSSTLSAQIPASLLLSTGPASLTVVNSTPGGGTSPAVTFTTIMPSPAVTAVTPGAVVAGTGTVLSVTGSGFVGGSTQVSWANNGVTTTLTPTVAAGGASLVVFVSAAVAGPAGAATLTAVNPAPGGASAPFPVPVNNPAPVLSLVTPASVTAGGAGLTINLLGGGFNAGSTVTWTLNGVPTALATTFGSAASLTATVPAAAYAAGGVASVTVANPSPGGGVSAPRTVTVFNPAPTIASATPSVFSAGGPAVTVVLAGTGFNALTTASWSQGGTTPLSVSAATPTTLTFVVPASLLATPGPASLVVTNSAPGGGTASVGVSAVGPAIAALSPLSSPPMTPGASPITLLLSGSGFAPNSVVYADGTPLATTYFGPGQLSAQLPSTVPDMDVFGARAVGVRNGAATYSNVTPFIVGSGGNVGLIALRPFAPEPGTTFELAVEGGPPGAFVSLILDLGTPIPVHPFVDATQNLVLGTTPFAGSAAPLIFIVDGLGLGGPPDLTVLDAAGRLVLPALPAPDPPFGFPMRTQAVLSAPAAIYGFTLTWTRVATL